MNAIWMRNSAKSCLFARSLVYNALIAGAGLPRFLTVAFTCLMVICIRDATEVKLTQFWSIGWNRISLKSNGSCYTIDWICFDALSHGSGWTARVKACADMGKMIFPSHCFSRNFIKAKKKSVIILHQTICHSIQPDLSFHTTVVL